MMDERTNLSLPDDARDYSPPPISLAPWLAMVVIGAVMLATLWTVSGRQDGQTVLGAYEPPGDTRTITR